LLCLLIAFNREIELVFDDRLQPVFDDGLLTCCGFRCKFLTLRWTLIFVKYFLTVLWWAWIFRSNSRYAWFILQCSMHFGLWEGTLSVETNNSFHTFLLLKFLVSQRFIVLNCSLISRNHSSCNQFNSISFHLQHDFPLLPIRPSPISSWKFSQFAKSDNIKNNKNYNNQTLIKHIVVSRMSLITTELSVSNFLLSYICVPSLTCQRIRRRANSSPSFLSFKNGLNYKITTLFSVSFSTIRICRAAG
jgi:hypothetical protein